MAPAVTDEGAYLNPSAVEPQTAADAKLIDARARMKRAEMEASPASPTKERLRAEIGELEGQATRLHDAAHLVLPELLPGRGGEVSPLPDARMPLGLLEVSRTVQASPELIDAEASVQRLELARNADALALAVEAAESIGAEDAIQKMLAHQTATGHVVLMKLFASVQDQLTRPRDLNTEEGRRAQVNADRTATAAARLMDSFSRTVRVLDLLKHGGQQHVTVQHVVVAEGGQAVVAGSVGRQTPARVTKRGPRRSGG